MDKKVIPSAKNDLLFVFFPGEKNHSSNLSGGTREKEFVTIVALKTKF